jgi:hypothetical protein
MSELDGFQLIVEAWVGQRELVFTWDNVSGTETNQVLARWRRPRWLRSGHLQLVDNGGDEPVALAWKDIIGIRVQPMVEVLT